MTYRRPMQFLQSIAGKTCGKHDVYYTDIFAVCVCTCTGALLYIIISSTLSRPCLPYIVIESVWEHTDRPSYWLSTQHEILHITFLKVQFKNIFKNISSQKYYNVIWKLALDLYAIIQTSKQDFFQSLAALQKFCLNRLYHSIQNSRSLSNHTIVYLYR